jgi:cytidine kinase
MVPSLLVYGNPTIDEVVRDNHVRVLPGGGALFSSMAAASLGSRVKVIGNVGRDYPEKYLKSLRLRGVDTGLLHKVPGSTTRFRIQYENDRRKLWLVAPGTKISSPRLQHYQAVHLSPVFHEISSRDILRVRSRCKFLSLDFQGMIRTVDSSGLVKTVRRRLDSVLRICNLVKGSVEEFDQLELSEKRSKIVRRLFLLGPEFALLTLGSHGAILGIRDGSQFSIPAFPDPEVFDPTGAGDILAGSWLSVYLRTHDPVWSAAVGSAFASLTSRRMGVSKFTFSRNELLSRSAWVYSRVKRFRGS